MVLSSLTLQNYRSYEKADIRFSPGVTLIYGPNSSGKTNILEALWSLSLGKSFRADRETEVIRWGREVARIKGTIAEGNDQADDATKLEVVMTQGSVAGRTTQQKRFFVNGVAKRMLDFAGIFRVVLFWPEHLALVTNSPSLRRKYLDSVLSQVDREYRRNLGSYERGLAQRNKLLELLNEGRASRSQFQFWDQLLIRTGGYLTDRRESFLSFVNAYTEPSMRYVIAYDKSVISEARLDQYREEEVAAKATLVGPHRDDFQFFTPARDEKESSQTNVSTFGSRGEQRLAVLWLKLAELEYVTERSREAGSGSARPILLLDDIFSELDRTHRTVILDLVRKQQTVVTSADDEVRGLLTGSKKGQTVLLNLPLRS